VNFLKNNSFQIKDLVFEYLGKDSEYHLLKVYFPVIKKSISKFSFISKINKRNSEKIVGNYGVILRLKPENLFFINKYSDFIQMEIKTR